jgi:hypothetical protein
MLNRSGFKNCLYFAALFQLLVQPSWANRVVTIVEPPESIQPLENVEPGQPGYGQYVTHALWLGLFGGFIAAGIVVAETQKEEMCWSNRTATSSSQGCLLPNGQIGELIVDLPVQTRTMVGVLVSLGGLGLLGYLASLCTAKAETGPL